MSSVFERVRDIIVDLIGVDESQIKPTTSFEELHLDSLDLVELVIRVEEEFAGEDDTGGQRFEITDEQAKNILAVHDVVTYLITRGIRDA